MTLLLNNTINTMDPDQLASNPDLQFSKRRYGPAHEILVLIASASSNGSDEQVHL